MTRHFKNLLSIHGKNFPCEIPRCQPLEALFEIRSYRIKLFYTLRRALVGRGLFPVRRFKWEIHTKNRSLENFLSALYTAAMEYVCFLTERCEARRTKHSCQFYFFWNLYTKLAATQQKMLSVSSRRMIGDLKNLPSGYLREVFSLVLLFQTIPCLIEGDKSFYSLNGLILTLT